MTCSFVLISLFHGKLILANLVPLSILKLGTSAYFSFFFFNFFSIFIFITVFFVCLACFLSLFSRPSLFSSFYSLSLRGRTIIFSIHQPKYSIYKLFDTLTLVLDGSLAYHGPADNSPVHYFRELGMLNINVHGEELRLLPLSK